MTDLQTAVTNLITHIGNVQISAVDIFAKDSGGTPTSVYLTTDPPSQNVKRFPKAILRIDGIRPHGEYPAELQFADVSVELQQDTQPGPHGHGQFRGKHTQHGIEDIRAAVVAATGVINGSSTPVIQPYCHLVDGGGRMIADGNMVSVTLVYEMMLEVT